jgi:arsenate reductase
VASGRAVSTHRSRLLEYTTELTDWADRVVTMGCGDECPVTGKPTEDWELDDVAGKSQDEVEEIAVQVATRMSKLLKELHVPTSA